MERTGTKIKYVGFPKTKKSYRAGFSLTPARGPAALMGDSQSLLPLTAVAMMKGCNFVAILARAGKQEIKPLVDRSYGHKTLSSV